MKKIYYLLNILLFLSLSGCATSIMRQDLELKREQFQYEKAERLREHIKKLKRPKTEKELILSSFSDSDIIIKAFEKLGCSMFDIAGFLNEYGKDDIDGFCDFLAEKYPFTKWFRWALDREIFDPAKRNHCLLKRLNKGR